MLEKSSDEEIGRTRIYNIKEYLKGCLIIYHRKKLEKLSKIKTTPYEKNGQRTVQWYITWDEREILEKRGQKYEKVIKVLSNDISHEGGGAKKAHCLFPKSSMHFYEKKFIIWIINLKGQQQNKSENKL